MSQFLRSFFELITMPFGWSPCWITASWSQNQKKNTWLVPTRVLRTSKNQFIYMGDVMNYEDDVEETITWLSHHLQTISAEICGKVSGWKWSSISSDRVKSFLKFTLLHRVSIVNGIHPEFSVIFYQSKWVKISVIMVSHRVCTLL